MAFESNDGSKQVAGGIKMYTGVADFKVIAINPTKAELEAMGRKVQEEPTYITSTQEGGNKVRLDIYLKNDKMETKLALFLEDSPRINKAGDKNEFINKFGQGTWGANAAEVIAKVSAKSGTPWFKADGIRIAKVGEVGLTEFIKQWANVAQGQVCQLDTIEEIVRGNVKELKDLVPVMNSLNNGIKCLIGVVEKEYDGQVKQYQAVYSRCFMRPYQKNLSMFTKSLNDDYGEFKADYQNSLEFQEYTGKKEIESAVSQPKEADLF